MSALAVGTVTHIFTKAPEGEVTFPKAPAQEARATFAGFAGDRQEDPVDADYGGHGGPLKALCVWSTEIVKDLEGQGHPMCEGSCGENLLISGLPWEKIVPGARIRIGDTLIEATAFAHQCYKQPQNFKKGNYMVANKDGMFRVYFAVLREGPIKVGDKAELHIGTIGAKPYLSNPYVVGRAAAKGKLYLDGKNVGSSSSGTIAAVAVIACCIGAIAGAGLTSALKK